MLISFKSSVFNDIVLRNKEQFSTYKYEWWPLMFITGTSKVNHQPFIRVGLARFCLDIGMFLLLPMYKI